MVVRCNGVSRGRASQATVNVTGRMRVNNGELLKDAAIAGMGITYLPTFIVGSALKDGRLVPVLDNFRPRAVDVIGQLSATSSGLATGTSTD